MEKLQREITKQREDMRSAVLTEVAKLLSRNDLRKVSYFAWTPTSASLWSPPTPDTVIPPELYALGVSTWFGIEAPSLLELLGRPIGRGRLRVKLRSRAFQRTIARFLAWSW